MVYHCLIFFFSRIKKYLPAKEHLRDTETPLSTLWNDEKIRELEEEQKVWVITGMDGLVLEICQIEFLLLFLC